MPFKFSKVGKQKYLRLRWHNGNSYLTYKEILNDIKLIGPRPNSNYGTLNEKIHVNFNTLHANIEEIFLVLRSY